MNSPQTIQPFKVQFSQSEKDDFLLRAEKIVTEGNLIPGENNAELEKLFTEFIGARYAIAVSSGTAGLEIIFRIFELQNKNVLVPANTNYATAEAALRAGCNVILYDATLFPDFDDIKRSITENTKALVIVHIGGYITPEIESISKFCRDNNIYLIEDASHAHGSKYSGKFAGTFGDAAAFSMFATKILTTSEGGIIVSNNKEVRELGVVYRDQGKDDDGVRNILFGSAWRMSEIHAALGVVQMPNASTYIQHNNRIVKYYVDHLNQKKLEVPHDEKAYYSGHKFVVLAKSYEERESLKSFLHQNNIKAGKGIYDVPLHQQPALSQLNVRPYPKSEAFSRTHMCLPIWKGLSEEEVQKIVDVVNRWQES